MKGKEKYLNALLKSIESTPEGELIKDTLERRLDDLTVKALQLAMELKDTKAYATILNDRRLNMDLIISTATKNQYNLKKHDNNSVSAVTSGGWESAPYNNIQHLAKSMIDEFSEKVTTIKKQSKLEKSSSSPHSLTPLTISQSTSSLPSISSAVRKNSSSSNILSSNPQSQKDNEKRIKTIYATATKNVEGSISQMNPEKITVEDLIKNVIEIVKSAKGTTLPLEISDETKRKVSEYIETARSIMIEKTPEMSNFLGNNKKGAAESVLKSAAELIITELKDKDLGKSQKTER
ncbi:MAG: hypothetical protein ACHP6I_01970 [Rickettsiales bacterium]